jgi:hypothetical protein
VEVPADGVFRALEDPDPDHSPPDAVSMVAANRWVASISLSGEVYQAFFATEAEAADALALAGFTQPDVAA